MKTRNSFVSNSSSCSFIITNLTDRNLSLTTFVKETVYLLYDFHKEYYQTEITMEQMIDEAEKECEIFLPHESKCLVFGDEQGTGIGQVYDYMLREGGKTQSFKWEFDEYHR